MKIDNALALAARGFRVFPLSPGSKIPPKDFAWKVEATTNPAMIKRWWQNNPDYNVGVATGRGTLVVDADCKKDAPGLASLDLLDMMGMPDSYRVKTPSGGMHVYLKSEHAHGNRVDSLDGFRGIDIRCEGGYVVGPGSVIDGETYSDIGDPSAIEASPDWFDTILLNSAKGRVQKTEQPLVDLDLPANIDRATHYLVNLAPEAVEGAGGNETTFRVAARCRDYGLSEGQTFEVMLDHWNEQKASPPWQPEDLATVVGNAFTYATGGWGSALAVAEFDVIDIDEGERPKKTAEPDEKAEKPKKKILKVLDYAAMLAMPEPEWLVEGIVQKNTSGLLFGKSNAFKSFLAIDIGLHVATGRDWHGKPVQQANVLFVTTEGAVGVARQRIPGWYAHYDVPIDQRTGAFMYPQEISIDNSGTVDLLIATAKHHKVGLLVLDIFGGTMDGTEVEDTTARAWTRNVQRIIREAGCTALTVAHTGWQDETRARMHTHFWGSFDSRLRVVGDKEKRETVLEIERHKDADSLGQFGFKLEAVFDTLVPIADANVKTNGEAAWPNSLKVALKALEDIMETAGEMRFEEGFPACRVVPLDAWRDRSLDLGISTSDKEDSRRKTFSRAKMDLIRRGAVSEKDGYAWNTADE